MTQESAGRRYGRGLRTDEYPARRGDAPLVLVGEPSRPRRHRRGFTLIAVAVGLLVAVVVATYALAGSLGGRGADTPDRAVDGFLSAIYEARDPRAAGTFVCDSARDAATLDQIVFQVSQYEQAYTGARTTWSYPPIRTEGDRAAADVTLTMTTANEQVASRLVTLILVDHGGWWVCDVRTV
jgi:hypothetical protein